MKLFNLAIVGILLVTMFGSVFAQCATCGANDNNGDIQGKISDEVTSSPVFVTTPIKDIKAIKAEDVNIANAVEVEGVVDALVNETKEGDNFTKNLPMGSLISAVELVKRDFFKDMIKELRELDAKKEIHIYAVKFNRAINAIKSDIRKKINEENLTVKVVREIAERKLSEIIEELESSASETEVANTIGEVIKEKNLPMNRYEVLDKLAIVPPRFLQKAYRILKAGSDQAKTEVIEQFTASQEQLRTKIMSAVQKFKDLQKKARDQKIKELRSLLNEKAQLPELVDAMGA